VPFAPGGSTDLTARAVGEHLATTLRQNVIVENVGGAGGMIGTARVSRATADGHTLLLHQLALAANATLFPKTSANVERELSGVGLVNYSPMILVGRKSLSANSIQELSAWMRQSGQRAKFGHAGPGYASHLCAALFAEQVGTQVEMVPYRGGAPAMADIVAGHVDLYFGPPVGIVEYIQSGLIKGFGVSSKERVAQLPNLPSLVQVGYPKMEIRFWQGLFAPTATPKPILEKLNAALRLALADVKVTDSFGRIGFTAFAKDELTTTAADRLLRAEVARWGEIIHTNNIQAE